MAEFEQFEWKNNPSGETPITAEQLNRLEVAIAQLYSVAFFPVAEKPASMDSPGKKNQFFYSKSEGYIYLCTDDNEWNLITVTGWE